MLEHAGNGAARGPGGANETRNFGETRPCSSDSYLSRVKRELGAVFAWESSFSVAGGSGLIAE